jgi:hypothetical protein
MMQSEPFRVATSITGDSMVLEVLQSAGSTHPTAGAVADAAYKCDALWEAWDQSRPAKPDKCNHASIPISSWTTQRLAAMNFITQLPAKTTRVISVFAVGRDTPLQGKELVPAGPGIALPLVLSEKQHPEFADAITRLCEKYMLPVLQAKVDVANANTELKQMLKQHKKSAKSADLPDADGLLGITAIQTKIIALKEKCKSEHAFVTPLANPLVVKHAATHGVQKTIESIRRLFMFFLRQSVYEAEKHNDEYTEAMRAVHHFRQQAYGRYSPEIYRRYFAFYTCVSIPHPEAACYDDVIKYMQLKTEMDALKLTGARAIALLKETFKWTVCHDVDCRGFYDTPSDSSDGQLKTIVSAIMHTAEQQYRQLKTDRQRQWQAAKQAERAERKCKRDEAELEKKKKRDTREAQQLSAAAAAAAKYKDGGAASLNQQEMRALAHVAFNTKLAGKKREMVDQFDEAAAASDAAWLENVCKRAKKE